MAIYDIIQTVIDEFQAKSDYSVLYLALNSELIVGYEAFTPDQCSVIDLQIPEVFFSPIAPMMYLIKKKKPSKKLIEDAAYPLQKDNLVAYFSGELCNKRDDVVLQEEIIYEKQRLQKSLVQILSNTLDNTVLILNAHLISIETINLLKEIENTPESTTKFILCFDVSTFGDLQKQNPFFAEIITQKNFFEFSFPIESEKKCKYPELTCKKNFENVYPLLSAERMFFSLQTGQILTDFIREHSIAFHFTREQSAKMNLETGIMAFYKGDYEMSNLFLTRVLKFSTTEPSSIEAMFYLAYLNYTKTSFNDALKYANMIRRKVPTYSLWYSLASAIAFITKERICREDTTTQYSIVKDMLKKNNLTNNLIYIVIHIPYIIQTDITQLSTMLKEIDLSIEDAKLLDNQFILSSCYQCKGILLSKLNNRSESMLWYQKAAKLRGALDDIQSYVKIKNSLSYEYLLQAQYEDAFNQINSYLDRIAELNEKQEIAISIFNLGKILFFSRNFDQAFEVFQKTQKLMTIFNLSDSIFCTSRDTQLFIAIIYFTKGNLTQAKIMLQRLIMEKTILSLSSIPMIDYLKALIVLSEGKLDSSKKHFAKAIDLFEKNCSGQEHQLCFMYFEYASYLDYYNHAQSAEVFHKRGIEVALKYDLRYYTSIIGNLTCKEYQEAHFPFSKVNYNAPCLESAAKQESLQKSLTRKITGIHFLNRIITAGSKAVNSKEYIESFVQAFFDYSLCNAIFIAEKDSQIATWKIISSRSAFEIAKPNNIEWKQNVAKIPPETELCFKRNNKGHLFCNISRYNFVGAVLVIPSENTNLEQDDPTIFNSALAHLQTQMTMFNQQEFVIENSVTDELTGLQNRQALLQVVSVTSEMVDRTYEKTQTKLIISVVSLDLDNFSEYKKKFGQDASQELLVNFAKILQEKCRKTDSLFRSQEDRFIIIMTGTNREEAKQAIERVFIDENDKNLPKTDGKLLAKTDDKTLPKAGCKTLPKTDCIPLTFSAGICSNLDTESLSDIADVLEKSEDALRWAKSDGKNNIKVWGV